MRTLSVLSVLLAALTLPLAVHAQSSQESNPGNQEGQASVDCTDPMQAGTANCQNSSQTQPILPGVTNQQRYAQPGSLPVAGANRNYSDTEGFDRTPSGLSQPQQNLPPEPLTEFQKFAASTTGQILPIFGANLFRRVPSTFAPLNQTPVPPTYQIGPGDELRIRIWGQVNFQANVRVDRSGNIYLPQVGQVQVVGLPFSDLADHLRAAVGRVYRNFSLTADVGEIRAIQVYVAGEARRPGVYTVSSLSTLVDALFASGGPSAEGSLRHIELRREGATVTDFDLYDLLVRGDKSKDVKLLNGDVIFIPPAGPQVAVTGSIRNPAIFELRDHETLNDLIQDAGGVSAVASGARISIERIQNHQDREAMEVAFDAAGLATPLADGDLVRVYSIVPRYSKTVTLRGNTANPGRFAWHPGMRLSDLIPDKQSLITRNYWWRRAQLGLPAPEFESADSFDNMRQPAGNHPDTLTIPSPYPVNPADQPASDSANQRQNGSQESSQSGMSQGPRLTAQQRGGSSSLAVAQEGSSSQMPPQEQRTRVGLLAPDVDWNYAVIERQDPANLKTTLIPFDLGKLVLQHDASQNLELRPGDVVSIFSAADIRVPLAQQTKLVTLEGEFAHAGVYSVQPGETLRQLVERAGGITSDAYLYGSEFTRESTRAVQQARINEYVQSLSASIQRSNLALAASQSTSPQDAATATAAQSSEQQLIARLQRVRATGRIVLSLKPASRSVDSLPDLPLENGDRFILPHVPATVNVIGAVYDQNSFLYLRGRHVGSYLKMAGGPNRVADWRHEFVIRADGEVVSREMTSGLWNNQFQNLNVNPGDTIVIPEKTFKPSLLKGVLDWSQIFSQLALGSAAINVLH